MTGEKLTRPTVLVIEDEPLIRWSLCESLSERGYQVRIASSAAQARALFVELAGEPLVVVLDLRLPDVDDLTLVREIRQQLPEAPVIVMSAYGSSETRRETKTLGVSSFVDKPFDVQAMAKLVEDVWQQRSG